MSEWTGREPGFEIWRGRMFELADRIREAAREAMRSAIDEGGLAEASRPVGQGVGDLTYGVDEVTERVMEKWFQELTAEEPLSLFSEDRGWRHRGPDGEGGSRELEGFGHGGPRLVVDPVDGTRNLMADLRAAWTVMALCAAGEELPWMRDVRVGVVSEIADSRAERYRVLSAVQGEGAWLSERWLRGGEVEREGPLVVDEDDRVDHGYFSFFRYAPVMRPMIADIEAGFFKRLAEEEGADVRNCFDDQYISNGGQLALLALGVYRFVADLRAWLAPRFEEAVTVTKAYDCAGAVLVAREAGCVVEGVGGRVLDFPLEGVSGVSFVGFVNEGTAGRVRGVLRGVLPERERGG